MPLSQPTGSDTGIDAWIQVIPALIFPVQENISCDHTGFREDLGAETFHCLSRRELLAHLSHLPQENAQFLHKIGLILRFERGHFPASGEKDSPVPVIPVGLPGAQALGPACWQSMFPVRWQSLFCVKILTILSLRSEKWQSQP